MKYSQTSVPASLLLDLRPRGAEDLYRVHARCLQNPHALVRAAAQQKLSRVIEHLGRTTDLKLMLSSKLIDEILYTLYKGNFSHWRKKQQPGRARQNS